MIPMAVSKSSTNRWPTGTTRLVRHSRAKSDPHMWSDLIGLPPKSPSRQRRSPRSLRLEKTKIYVLRSCHQSKRRPQRPPKFGLCSIGWMGWLSVPTVLSTGFDYCGVSFKQFPDIWASTMDIDGLVTPILPLLALPDSKEGDLRQFEDAEKDCHEIQCINNFGP